MKVTIEHIQKNVGLFWKKMAPAIRVSIDFTDAELEAIHAVQLYEYVFIKPKRNHFEKPEIQPEVLRVKDVVRNKGFYLVFNDVYAAKSDEPRIRQALADLKQALQHGMVPRPSKDTFEL